MIMAQLADRIRDSYNVIQSSIYGDGENLILKVEKKHFAICVVSSGVTVYETFQESSGDWIFLTSSKTGKSLKTVDNFIQSRV